MDVSMVLMLMTGLFVAAVMIGVGVYHVRSRKPVTFYTGEKAPAVYELTDVHAWNVSHGRMWIIYGCVIALGFVCTAGFCNTVLCVIPLFASVCVPVPVMIFYHHRLMKTYKRG